MKKRLKDICNIRKGADIVIRDMVDGGKYPVYSGGMRPTGYTDKSNHPGGVCTIIEKGSAGFVDYRKAPFFAGGHLYLVEPKDPNEVDPLYLYFALKSKEDEIKSLSVRTGVGFIHLLLLNTVTIDIIEISEQRKIAKTLKAIQAYSESLQKMGGGIYAGFFNKLLKALFKSLGNEDEGSRYIQYSPSKGHFA